MRWICHERSALKGNAPWAKPGTAALRASAARSRCGTVGLLGVEVRIRHLTEHPSIRPASTARAGTCIRRNSHPCSRSQISRQRSKPCVLNYSSSRSPALACSPASRSMPASHRGLTGPRSSRPSPARSAAPRTVHATSIVIPWRRSPSSASSRPTPWSSSQGGGWYTEILAPYLAAKGKLIAAAPAGRGTESMAKRFDANPALFGKVERANFPRYRGTAVAPGTARSSHFPQRAQLEDGLPAAREDRLQRGSLPRDLCDAQAGRRARHRGPSPAGVRERRTRTRQRLHQGLDRRALAEKAGFKFDGASEINANPKDTTDWKEGVWTLPPTLALGDVDKANTRRSAKATA